LSPVIAPAFADAVHSLQGLPHVADIRCIGLMAAIDFEPVAGKPGARSYACHRACLDAGVAIRMAGDGIVLSPPLVIAQQHIDQIATTLRHAIAGLD